MNYGHVYADIIWFGIVAGSSGLLLCQLHYWDEDLCKVNILQIYKLWLIYCLATGVVFVPHINAGTNMMRVAYGLLAVYLIVCSVMDTVLELVSDFLHYIGLLGGCLLLVSRQPIADVIVALILFTGIQWLLFRKMYGPADVAAFIVCAVYLAAEGRGMESYLVHMAITFLVLGIVQGIKGNVALKGNLKHPVALFPYITVGFFIII